MKGGTPRDGGSQPRGDVKVAVAPAVRWSHARPYLASFLVLVTISLGEIRIAHRLLYTDPAEYAFVVRSVSGVLDGAPPYEAWRHRFFAPALVAGLDVFTHDRPVSIELLGSAMLFAANFLLFALVRRKAGTFASACLAVAAFGLCRILLLYKLEYPWDGVTVFLFLLFGYAASVGRGLLWTSPLLAIGAVNHEAVLYIPLWYLLAPLDRPRASSRTAGSTIAAGAALAGLAISILGLRSYRHVASVALPEHPAEAATPILGNPIHVSHNFGQLLGANFRTDRAFISITVLSALAIFTVLIARRRQVRAAVWSTLVIASILCFGYVNETRLYLPLLAFWLAYAWPVFRVNVEPDAIVR